MHRCDLERCPRFGSLRARLVDRSLLQGNQAASRFLERAERTLPVGVRFGTLGRYALSTALWGDAARWPVELGEIRDRENGRLQTLAFAALLWQLFRALIEGALDTLARDLGRKVLRKILNVIDQSVEGFLNDALHLSPDQVAIQLKAEELGYL